VLAPVGARVISKGREPLVQSAGSPLAHWQVASHSVLRAQLSAGARLPCVRVTCHSGKSPWQVIPPIVTPNLALLTKPANNCRPCRGLKTTVSRPHSLLAEQPLNLFFLGEFVGTPPNYFPALVHQ
jgi:hypothetical protein